MNHPDELIRENEALRERLSRLSEASLRITEDLDFDTVLQEVVDGARLLTGADRGSIVTIGDSGQIQDFITSNIDDEELRHIGGLDEEVQREHFAYMSGLSGPLRVADFQAHATALGLPVIGPPLGPVGSFLFAPIRLQDAHVGHFYLSFKEGGEEFTQEDEDTLVLFASQAAMAIANARRHREERRARADLETLIDTSPVGVVVFDARTGAPRSFNREALRIVDSLRGPDQTPEDMLDVVSCRRADGREVSLRELPMAQLLSAGETVRAEEIVLGVPDGRSVTTLLNATPILSEQGAVESVVVTMQDMADVEELERMRAEFLAMVSHELRTPLTSIRGSAFTILDAGADLDPAVARQFVQIIWDQVDHMNDLVAGLLDVARIETGTLAVSPEPAEAAALVDRARNAFISAGGRNNLEIDVEPDLPLVSADRRRIVQVIGNLLSNAARNSLGSAAIQVSVVRDGVHVAFSVADQGRGIPAESLPHLFRKFSRVQAEEQGGDTGLGLAICKGIVEAHGGRIWAESDGPGAGARFTFTLPTVEDGGSGRAPGLAAVSTRREREDTGERARILAVDDEPQTLRYVRDTLAKSGYEPVVTGEPEEALRLMAEERPELVLLDLMLPGTDGIELMQAIQGIVDVPVIFLSAYGREEQIARAFDMGADDYVVKPFSPTELSARIRAALRRRLAPESQEPYVLGELTVDYAGRRVTLAGRRLRLTPTEYRMLAELSANAGRALTYERLLNRVWGGRGEGDVRAMRTIVNKLRSKLGESADNPTYIFTEPRVGYWMAAGETAEPGPPASP
ncbi:MAG: response regulator [Chloroflexota bacterium]|nr:response regulator [Chloroflexota bacterium]